MEIFDTLLGIAALYFWGHALYLVATKTKGVSGYEKFVLIVALGAAVLYILGTI